VGKALERQNAETADSSRLSASRQMRASGQRARGRRAASWAEWASIREQVLARAGWRCQACRVRRRLDVHHVVKRSQGGSDFDLDQLVALCRWCHDQTDAPYERGRLVVIALGAGQFTFEVVKRAARGTSPAPVPIFAHAGKTDTRDVVRGPDWTTVNGRSDTP
jgi:5-methylcytosine-specific restriction endonuclease McrA